MDHKKTMTAQDEYPAIYGEVCRDDFYGLRSLPIVPDVILDIGANIGVFTTFARFLFPSARIIAVEPDPRTRALLVQYTAHMPGVTHVAKALGMGEIWQGNPPLEEPYYGAVCSYVTANQLGFPEGELDSPPGLGGRDGLPIYKRSKISSVTLDELVGKYVKPGDKLLIKMDCEGGENYIFAHEPSMVALRRADVLTMETHYYTKGTGEDYQANAQKVADGLLSLSDTHDCILDDNKRYFQAIRKGANV